MGGGEGKGPSETLEREAISCFYELSKYDFSFVKLVA